jgi:hypothetical protein
MAVWRGGPPRTNPEVPPRVRHPTAAESTTERDVGLKLALLDFLSYFIAFDLHLDLLRALRLLLPSSLKQAQLLRIVFCHLVSNFPGNISLWKCLLARCSE